MSVGGAEKSRRDLFEYYMERRVERLKLSAVRIISGLVLGIAAALAESTTIAYALFTAYLGIILVSGEYARARYKLLRSHEPYTAGLISGLAAFVLGVILGSAL
ncbi:hypothetical protein [Hyperthermus butylicus]|uniref:Uncharacterized protein n=1 Tax=Hyperthermus butylicus (strain DSM 5456 / JCM 9403 / PLM1-5) TaxID=415426 RepID=A2BLT8_HYPBU|nr:hypothetical protein [Hyperthermus butylicus]ABM80949.1 hypothetical protein Hbut_1106 [Hyperthermus butylicus DSM 5456]